MPEQIQCPTCEKDDQIQKVSAVVTDQTYRGMDSYDGYWVTKRSELAKKLQPPDKPQEPGHGRLLAVIYFIVFGVFAGWFGVVVLFAEVSLLFSNSTDAEPEEWLFGCALGLFLTGIWLYLPYKQLRKHNKKEHDRKTH